MTSNVFLNVAQSFDCFQNIGTNCQNNLRGISAVFVFTLSYIWGQKCRLSSFWVFEKLALYAGTIFVSKLLHENYFADNSDANSMWSRLTTTWLTKSNIIKRHAEIVNISYLVNKPNSDANNYKITFWYEIYRRHHYVWADQYGMISKNWQRKITFKIFYKFVQMKVLELW